MILHVRQHARNHSLNKMEKSMIRKARAQAIYLHVNRYARIHGLRQITYKQAYALTLKIDTTDNIIGKVFISVAGGVVLAPVAEGGYWMVMRNPESTIYSLEVVNDFVNSSMLPLTSPGQLWFMMTHMGDSQ